MNVEYFSITPWYSEKVVGKWKYKKKIYNKNKQTEMKRTEGRGIILFDCDYL